MMRRDLLKGALGLFGLGALAKVAEALDAVRALPAPSKTEEPCTTTTLYAPNEWTWVCVGSGRRQEADGRWYETSHLEWRYVGANGIPRVDLPPGAYADEHRVVFTG